MPAKKKSDTLDRKPQIDHNLQSFYSIYPSHVTRLDNKYLDYCLETRDILSEIQVELKKFINLVLDENILLRRANRLKNEEFKYQQEQIEQMRAKLKTINKSSGPIDKSFEFKPEPKLRRSARFMR